MSNLSWNDQPQELNGAEIVAMVQVNKVCTEVRKLADGRWSVTAGNLFGSQTRIAPTAEEALRLFTFIKEVESDED